MTTATGAATQTTLSPWEVAGNNARQTADTFIDDVQPHVVTMAKATAAFTVTTLVTAGGEALKAGTTAYFPVIAPAAHLAIDSATAPTIAFSVQTIEPGIEPCVEKSCGVAKESVHASIDKGIDLSSRHFSSI